MPNIISNYNIGAKVRRLVGDALGAQVVELQLEKALENAKERSVAPQSFFGDPVGLFLGTGDIRFLPNRGRGGTLGTGFLTFTDMRAMAKNPIIGSIIATRLNQVAAFMKPQRNPWDLGFKIVSDDPAAQKDQKTIDAITQFMFGMGFEGFGEPSLEVFSRKYIRDSMTLDSAGAEIVFRRNGLPAYAVVVDGATIRKTKESLKYALPPSKIPWYVQVVPKGGVVDQIVTEYTYDQMMYGVRNPQTNITKFGYGESELEMLIRIVTTILNTERYNTSQLAQGGTQKGVLVVKGDANRKEFEAFKADFREAVRNAGDFWRPPVVRVAKDASVDWVILDRSNRDMEFGQMFDWLVKQATALYNMVPEEINWTIGGTGTKTTFESAQTPKITNSHMKGLNPLLSFFQSVLTHSLVKKLDPRFRIEFVGITADRKLETDFLVTEVKHFKTVNEIRADRNLPPLEGGDIILNPQFTGKAEEPESQFLDNPEDDPENADKIEDEEEEIDIEADSRDE